MCHRRSVGREMWLHSMFCNFGQRYLWLISHCANNILIYQSVSPRSRLLCAPKVWVGVNSLREKILHVVLVVFCRWSSTEMLLRIETISAWFFGRDACCTNSFKNQGATVLENFNRFRGITHISLIKLSREKTPPTTWPRREVWLPIANELVPLSDKR